MRKKKLILREEYFWYTCYDTETLSHAYILKDDINSLLDRYDIEFVYSRYNGLIDRILVAPVRVYYEATRKCNLSCKHCFNSSWRESKDQLHSNEIKKILQWFKQDGVLDIRFTGWEFTQREGWYEILLEAKKLWFIVSLNTNWVYESDEVIEKLANLNLNQVTVSLDWREDSHNQIRLWPYQNVFYRTIQSIQKLSALWAIVRINTVLNQGNIKDVPKILDFAGTYCDEINFFAMRHVGRAIWMMKNLSLDRNSFNLISKHIALIKKKYPKLNTLYGHQVMQSNSIMPNNVQQMKYGAPDGFTRFNIIDNGDLYAWGYTPYIKNDPSLLKLGNIITENYSLLDIWHHSDKLEWLRKSSWKLKDICNNCRFLRNNDCPGGVFEMELQKAFWDIRENPYCSKKLNFIDINSLPL